MHIVSSKSVARSSCLLTRRNLAVITDSLRARFADQDNTSYPLLHVSFQLFWPFNYLNLNVCTDFQYSLDLTKAALRRSSLCNVRKLLNNAREKRRSMMRMLKSALYQRYGFFIFFFEAHCAVISQACKCAN